MPWTVIVLIVLWTVAQLLLYLHTRGQEARFPGADEPEGAIYTVAEVLGFIHRFLIVALMGHGLVRKLRFVWILAFVWQAVQAGFGIVNMVLNQYEASAYTTFSGIGFYGIVLPITVAVVSFVLLLLPTTQRWIREGQSLGSSRSVV